MDYIKKNLNKIIIGIVILVIITFIYNNFFNKDESDFAESSEIVVLENEIDEISRSILQTLDRLNQIDINTDFFTEDFSQSGNLISFYDLIDFSKTDITPKNIGKDNPFSADSEFYNRVYGGADVETSTDSENSENNEGGDDEGETTE